MSNTLHNRTSWITQQALSSDHLPIITTINIRHDYRLQQNGNRAPIAGREGLTRFAQGLSDCCDSSIVCRLCPFDHRLCRLEPLNTQHTSTLQGKKPLFLTTAATQQTFPHNHYNRHKNKHVPHTYMQQRQPDQTHLKLLQMSSEDVHQSPGPATKYPCQVCARNVTSRGVSYKCHRCSGWVHAKCSGILNAAQYQRKIYWT